MAKSIPFRMVTDYEPRGDQPEAIEKICASIRGGARHTTLLGVTGSGKTFTMGKVIESLNRPTLIMAPNKTLAAQLYQEFKRFFPENAVEYFVSYYDYYQPEAYVAATDTYIEKEATINKDIEKLRLSATRSLLERRDVIIVASVSCIYGLGSPEFYADLTVRVEVDQEYDRQQLLRDLVHIQYLRNNSAFYPGTFRVRGDTVEVYLAYEDVGIRIEFFGDDVELIQAFDPLTGKSLDDMDEVRIFPTTHFVTPTERLEHAIRQVKEELDRQVVVLREDNRLLEAQRLSQRTQFDLEMLAETGFCHGIENYSRHLDGRPEGSPPSTLMDYFPEDYLLFADESHITVPQIGGMYRGDRARKENLVGHGFRLPSALDNRPLKAEEFHQRTAQVMFVSATPGPFELDVCNQEVVEQIIRPTGLCDPEIEVRPIKGQIDDLLEEVRLRIERDERTLVTTLTKRMAEDLSDYMKTHGLKVAWLHSEIDTLERLEILHNLRLGTYDVLVGINLLREGLDLPEVSLVAILDADKQGFLRSSRSLIQTVGRAARNVEGRVIMYADGVSDAMRETLDETKRRRLLQQAFNEANGITPTTVRRSLTDPLSELYENDYGTPRQVSPEKADFHTKEEAYQKIAVLEKQMLAHAEALEFEKAAEIRDQIKAIKDQALELR
ncbi:excinuclease ABC subunit UvrB [Sulfidibacter corallicola]|uniref:UvrABC system protein B n=1 Tax=Sulfidibacter corallicola TaxID=2818388 RepID=A0A8A4TFU0_SULCO|nr:excinuclease ABC subunit UvrB [Sulfidibacter corallicola]QTD48074.1 excinuclease ABC subunit UvrB [Sulfidibacter corallicola]